MIAWNSQLWTASVLKLTARASYRGISTPNSGGIPNSNVAALLSWTPQEDLPESKEIRLNGFVRSVRRQKHVAFASIDDGTSLKPAQAVLHPEQAKGLSNGCAVSLEGSWTRSPLKSGGQQEYELQVSKATIVGENDVHTFPLQKKYQSAVFLRTMPHLRVRLPLNALLLRLRSEMIAQATEFFAKNGFIQTHPPLITSSDCEGAGEAFTVATGTTQVSDEICKDESPPPDGAELFFGAPKYLTVSSQLHLEALAQSVGSVWALSPTFRAEKSDTSRHLSEFYMLEAELSFVDNIEQLMDLAESLLRHLTKYIQRTKLGQELLEAQHPSLEARWRNVIKPSWPRMTYKEAVQKLQDAVSRGETKFKFTPNHETGLHSEHERFIAQVICRGSPVFVTDYPRNQKPFYTAPSSNQPEGQDHGRNVACFDLLVPDVGEIVGGSVREHRLDCLMDSMRRTGLLKNQKTEVVGDSGNASDQVGSGLDWYLDLRRYGSVPHGGFGLGFDRLLCYLAGVDNIRDVVTFPRWHGRCEC